MPLDALRLMFSFCEFEELVRLRATCGTIKKESETILFARSVNKLPTAHRMDFYINKPSISLRPGWTQTYQNFYATIAFAIDDLAYLSSQEKVRASIGLGGDGTAVSLNWREEMAETYQDPYDDAHKQWKREVTFRAPLDVLDTFDVWDLFYSNLEDGQRNMDWIDDSVPLDISLDKVQPLKRLFLGLIIMSGSKNLEGSWKYGIALTCIERDEDAPYFSYSADEFIL